MATRRETDKATGKPVASRRRTHEYNHYYGLELKGREVPAPPKKKPAPDPDRKA
jgi:hypothetical protein